MGRNSVRFGASRLRAFVDGVGSAVEMAKR
jgi:hypothetical protein